MASGYGGIVKILQDMSGIHKYTQTKYLVLKKVRTVHGVRFSKRRGQGYQITCNNFFTSLELAKELAKQNSAQYYKTK